MKDFIIRVNGTAHTVPEEVVSYLQVVQLAHPGFIPGGRYTATVTFEHAKDPKQGILSDGKTVIVKPRNTEFDVIRANRS